MSDEIDRLKGPADHPNRHGNGYLDAKGCAPRFSRRPGWGGRVLFAPCGWVWVARPEVGMFVYLVLLGHHHPESHRISRESRALSRHSTLLQSLLLYGLLLFLGAAAGNRYAISFASVVVIAGMWYLFYGISSPARCSIDHWGVSASSNGLPQTFCWLGIIASLGCGFEAVWLWVAVRQTGGTESRRLYRKRQSQVAKRSPGHMLPINFKAWIGHSWPGSSRNHDLTPDGAPSISPLLKAPGCARAASISTSKHSRKVIHSQPQSDYWIAAEDHLLHDAGRRR